MMFYQCTSPIPQVLHIVSLKFVFSKVNDSLHDYYLLACSKNIYPDGPVLKEKAIEIADKLGVEGFKASNGWLDKWKKRHFIKRVTVCGESGDVSGPTVDSWKERMPEILNGYETGCFWRSLPDKGFGERGANCDMDLKEAPLF